MEHTDRRRPTRPALPACLVGGAAMGSALGHAFAALFGPAGAMAWLMAAMGLACLACFRSLAPGRFCVRKAAGHLMAMSAAMVLAHVVLLNGFPAGPSHLHGVPVSGSAAGHAEAMLSVMGIEILCLAAASAALRLTRTAPPRSQQTADRPAVVG